jgi:hypothetical protein
MAGHPPRKITMPLHNAHRAALLLVGFSLQVPAEPLPLPLETLFNAHNENVQLSGIGRLNLPSDTQCIGTLVDSRDPASPVGGPAYVVTAGHCVDLRNGVIVQDKPLEGSISFNFFVDTVDQRKTFKLKRVLWSSMQGVDLALLELDASLQQVTAQGIRPMRLGASPEAGGDVQVIGEPSHPDEGLRLARCLEQPVDVVIEYPWVWRKIKSNNCAGVHQGASGSPVIETISGQVIGLVNSVRQQTSDQPRCSQNNPCLDGPDHWTGTEPMNFAMPIERLRHCFQAGQVALDQQNCDLLPGFEFTLNKPTSAWRRLLQDSAGAVTAPTWNLDFTLDTPYYRYKTSASPLDCEDPRGYSQAMPSAKGRIDDPTPPRPGRYYLCVMGVDTEQTRPSYALMGNALSLTTQVLPAQASEVRYSHKRTAQGHVEIHWQMDQPHLKHYLTRKGPAAKLDCDQPFGYRPTRILKEIVLSKDLPVKLCSIAVDIDGKRSPPRADILGADEA